MSICSGEAGEQNLSTQLVCKCSSLARSNLEYGPECIKSSTLPLQADIACNQAHYARSGGSVRRFAELINAEVMREKMSSKTMEGHTLSYCKAAPSPQLRRMASLARSMLSPEGTWKMNARLQWPHLL